MNIMVGLRRFIGFVTILFISVVSINNSYKFPKLPTSLHHKFKLSATPISENWVDSFGDGIRRTGVKLAQFENGLRGIVATAPSSDEPVVYVKSDVALEVTNNRPPSPFPKFVPDEFWQKCMWDQRLGLKLLSEIKNISTTTKVAWIDQLPTSFNTPYHWSDDIINETQYAALYKRVLIQRESWNSFYIRWQSVTSSEYQSLVTLNDMIRVLECCNSRAFSGAYEGSSSQDRKALFIFTALLAIVWPLLNLSSITESIGLGLTVGLSVFLRDLFLSSFGNLKRYVLCPYVDMFNHRSDAQSDVSFNYFKNQFELRILRPYNSGDQVYISYGKPSNDRLLQFYGFIENDNPYDYYDYDENIITLLLNYGDEIATKLEFPIDPSPSIRLQYLYIALQNTKVLSKRASDKSELSTISATSSSSSSSTTTTSSSSNNNSDDNNSSNGNNSDNSMDNKKLRFYKTPFLTSEDSGKNTQSGDGNTMELPYVRHYDDISIRALRIFFASTEEWKLIANAWKLSPNSMNLAPNDDITITFTNPSTIDLEIVGKPLSNSTEKKIQNCLQLIAQNELKMKPTTIAQDKDILKNQKKMKKFNEMNTKDNSIREEQLELSILYRMEKKKLLTIASTL